MFSACAVWCCLVLFEAVLWVVSFNVFRACLYLKKRYYFNNWAIKVCFLSLLAETPHLNVAEQHPVGVSSLVDLKAFNKDINTQSRGYSLSLFCELLVIFLI